MAVTEQEDPQRFLNGGELVLTTGHAPAQRPEQRRFVRQVQRAGAVGIGFGIGLTHDAVPPALIAEANRWGLPVVEVPYETPFIAIGKLVADAQSADHCRQAGAADRRAPDPGPRPAHRRRPRRAPEAPGRHAAHRYCPHPVHRPAVQQRARTTPPRTRWASYPIPTGRRDACTLWVRQPFEDSGIVGYAQNLISVELNNMVKQRQAQRALCGQVLEDVIHGTLETSEAHAAARRRGPEQHPQERGAAGGVRGPPQSAGEHLGAAAAGERR